MSPSLLTADSVWPGKDRHLWLEVQHPSEALHPRQQHRQVVLESCGVIWWGEEGPASAVCYRIIQSPAARLQGFTGYWLCLLGNIQNSRSMFYFFQKSNEEKNPQKQKHVWLKFMKDSWKRVQGFISRDEWVTYSGIWWWTAANGYCLCFDCRCCWAQTLHHSSDWC